MARIASCSRAVAPIDELEVGEYPTTCTYCGARTELIAMVPSGEREERCLHCKQRYLVADAPEDDDPLVHGGDAGDIEVVDHKGVVVGSTGMSNPQLDALLNELDAGPELPEASQEDLDHLFGIKTPDYPDFGSF